MEVLALTSRESPPGWGNGWLAAGGYAMAAEGYNWDGQMFSYPVVSQIPFNTFVPFLPNWAIVVELII